MKDIVIYSTVRVVFGEHKGKLAVVVGIAECGHKDHDQLALVFVGATGQSSPFYIFRFAVELAAQTAPEVKPGIPRIRRFDYNNLVKVTDYASAHLGHVGRVIHVYDTPVEQDFTGRADGVFHARYKVEFSYRGTTMGCLSTSTQDVVLYDYQLRLA